MTNFNELNIPEFLLKSLTRLGISEPTPIQAATLPLALNGKDILASAQTGSGKTLAYLIPLINTLMKDENGKALILAPTRELAVQIKDILEKLFAQQHMFSLALLIGGDSMDKQIMQLKRKARIVIGTPGRVIDHLKRRNLTLRDVKVLVLDEIDRMLDMGFSIQLEEIKAYMGTERQTLMFSATLPHNIVKLAEEYLVNYERVTIGSSQKPAAQIKQSTIFTSAGEKYSFLLAEINKREGSIIVFVKTKRGADLLADKLNMDGHKSFAMHGDLQQRKREKVIREFRNKKARILVATDVAARGLDIPHIEHVINHDLPSPEDYIHRVGRTGRGSATGEAVSFVTPDESGKWKDILYLIDPEEAAKYKASANQNSRSRNSRSGGGFGRSSRGGSRDGGFGRSSENRSRDGGGFGRSSENRSRDAGGFSRPSENRSRDAGEFGRPSENRSRDAGEFGRPSENRSRDGGFGRPSENRSRDGGFGRPSENRSRDGGFGRSSENRSRDGNGFGRPSENRSRDGNGFGRPSENRSRDNNSFGRPSDRRTGENKAEYDSAVKERKFEVTNKTSKTSKPLGLNNNKPTDRKFDDKSKFKKFAKKY